MMLTLTADSMTLRCQNCLGISFLWQRGRYFVSVKNSDFAHKFPEESSKPPVPCPNWPREPGKTNTWLRTPKCTSTRRAFLVRCSTAVKLGPPRRGSIGASLAPTIASGRDPITNSEVLARTGILSIHPLFSHCRLSLLHGWWTRPKEVLYGL